MVRKIIRVSDLRLQTGIIVLDRSPIPPPVMLDVAIGEGQVRAVVMPVTREVTPPRPRRRRRVIPVADAEDAVVDGDRMFVDEHPGATRPRIDKLRVSPLVERRVVDVVPRGAKMRFHIEPKVCGVAPVAREAWVTGHGGIVSRAVVNRRTANEREQDTALNVRRVRVE